MGVVPVVAVQEALPVVEAQVVHPVADPVVAFRPDAAVPVAARVRPVARGVAVATARNSS